MMRAVCFLAGFASATAKLVTHAQLNSYGTSNIRAYPPETAQSAGLQSTRGAWQRKLTYGTLVVRFTRNEIAIADGGGYESRSESMSRLLIAGYHAGLRGQIPADRAWELLVWTNDVAVEGEHTEGSGEVAMCATRSQGYRHALPPFSVDAWPQVGIPSYALTAEQIMRAGAEQAVDRRVFWRGAASTHPLRHRLVALAARHPTLADIGVVEWVRSDPAALHKHTPGYISLVESVRRYGALLDIRGVGHSARLPLLMWSGRPLLIVDRPDETWFYWQLVPMFHYIPVAADLSDLVARMQWTLDNSEAAAAIGRNALAFAQANLTASAVASHIAGVMWRFARPLSP